MKHTPSPWSVVGIIWNEDRSAPSGRKGIIVSSGATEYQVSSAHNTIAQRIQKGPDAALIAAAPDLYAAMRACLADLEHYASTHGPGPDLRLAEARAALARAEVKP